MTCLNFLSSDSYPVFVGKYDFSTSEQNMLNFKEGDLLYIINTGEGGWWYARSKHTGQEGYIPSNYIAEYELLHTEM